MVKGKRSEREAGARAEGFDAKARRRKGRRRRIRKSGEKVAGGVNLKKGGVRRKRNQASALASESKKRWGEI